MELCLGWTRICSIRLKTFESKCELHAQLIFVNSSYSPILTEHFKCRLPDQGQNIYTKTLHMLEESSEIFVTMAMLVAKACEIRGWHGILGIWERGWVGGGEKFHGDRSADQLSLIK